MCLIILIRTETAKRWSGAGRTAVMAAGVLSVWDFELEVRCVSGVAYVLPEVVTSVRGDSKDGDVLVLSGEGCVPFMVSFAFVF